MFPNLLTIGSFSLHTYGLMVAIGFVVGFFLSRREMLRQGYSSDFVDQLVLVMMLIMEEPKVMMIQGMALLVMVLKLHQKMVQETIDFIMVFLMKLDILRNHSHQREFIGLQIITS